VVQEVLNDPALRHIDSRTKINLCPQETFRHFLPIDIHQERPFPTAATMKGYLLNQIVNSETFYLSVQQVAARYGVADATIWRWKREGKFPRPFKLSEGCTRWRLADIEDHDAKLEMCFAERLDYFGIAA
jgi:prophage regulatory protein